ncbi:hypothetical protein HZS_2331 [Henneguya salminicola]|nr:hypothetical protein HZS_2331 [Henneguya salminicola]
MIVKTGGRHESLIKMCKSMWKYYPKLKSIIVDDFKENASFKFILFLKNYSSYLTYIPTNQFTGISRGRNIALSLVKTKYFLLLDDDYNFNSKTNLMTLASILESTDATIAGGEHRVGHDTICNYFGIFLTKHHNKVPITLFHINGRVYEEIIGFKNCYRVDITKNFYIARTNVILQNGGWNNDLQYMEHEDFFLRLAYTKKKVVWCGDIRISHCQKPDDLRRKRESHAVYDQEKWISFHNFTNYDWITDP